MRNRRGWRLLIPDSPGVPRIPFSSAFFPGIARPGGAEFTRRVTPFCSVSSRRRWLLSAAASTASLAALPLARAAEPFVRTGPPRLQLSLAAYSFRDDFSVPKGAPAGTRPRLDMPGFLDFCAAQGCAGAELTSYYFPAGADDDYFRRVRRHAFLRGVTISGTAVGNDFGHPAGPVRDREIASVKEWIRKAAVLGAPHIRVFAGVARGQGAAEARKGCIAALEDCAELAGQHGIFLGVENHGGMVTEADDLVGIVRAVKSPWVGINLDTGNFHTADPYGDLEKCAPYAVNVQYKGYVQARGQARSGPADLARTIGILKRAGYQGWVALEYELAEDAWTRVPGMLQELRAAMAA